MSDASDRTSAALALKKLGRSAPGFETAAVEAAGAEALAPERAESARDRMVESIERETQRELQPDERAAVDELLLEHGTEAMRALNQDGAGADLSDNQLGAVEAIVEVDGSRPSLPVTDQDTVDTSDPRIGTWEAIRSQKVASTSQNPSARANARVPSSAHGSFA